MREVVRGRLVRPQPRLRFLIVDHYYGAVIRSIYASHPGLVDRSYAEQRAVIDDQLFGQTTFEVRALRDLGHEAWDSLVNIYPLQRAWLREHGGRLPSRARWGISLRRGWIPWPRRPDDGWMAEALLAQVRTLEPDVVHVQSMDLLGPATIARLKREVRLVVGQIAAELPIAWDYHGYDLVVSSIPGLVDRFRRDGIAAEWLPLAFEPSLATPPKPPARDIPVSFIGSLTSSHPRRIEVLESVARAVPLQTWTGDEAALTPMSPVRTGLRGVAWGRGMYEILARSRITLNDHGRVAAGAANNLRLYEATGMGALLVTDAASNLADLFDAGRELVTYRSPREAGEIIRHYLERPEEAEAIARAGQARTLRDHTWTDRMERLTDLIGRRA